MTATQSRNDDASQKTLRKSVLTPMDVESSSPNESIHKGRSSSPDRPPTPKWFSLLRYWTLASIALIFTLLCPGTRDYSIWPPIIAYCFTIVLFVRVHRVDPGIITQEIMEGHFYDELDYLGQSRDHAMMCTEQDYEEHRVLDPLVLKNADVAGFPNGATRRKVCTHCQLAPPLRSHHCSRCQHCIATFDHHCELVGNCIGERNRCIFWWFLFSQAVAFALCNGIIGSSHLGLSTLLFSRMALSPETMFQALVVFGTKIYLYSLSFAAYIMLAMHSFFAAANLTTFEVRFGSSGRRVDYLRNVPSVMDLPFSEGGCIGNVSRMCCTSSNKAAFPTMWQLPEAIDTNSEKWWEHPWQNKYWSCCWYVPSCF